MGLLDYADAARQKLKGLLGVMPLVQIAQGQAETPTLGGLLASLKAMPVFSPDAGQSAYEAALNIGPMGLGKIVYHGSPHKFDKFDASKIGTGEGAQAYGHGQYLADAEGVAKDYAKRLGNQAWGVGGDNASGWFAEWAAPSGKQSLDSRKYFKTKQEAMEFAKSKDTGEYLYKADLPDEWIPKMLDWDKPLSEQSPEVQKAFLNAQAQGDPILSQLLDTSPSGMQLQGMIPNAKGAAAYKTVAEQAGGHDRAAKILREAGIPGIRYLDGGSRGKGQGSYNYVVFPGLEDQVKILERNGIPLSGLLGGQ